MSKSIVDYMDKPTEKRVLSDDGTTGVSPEPKRSNHESEVNEEIEVFNPPDDAPEWVMKMMACMRKLYQRFDTYKKDTDVEFEAIRDREKLTNVRIDDLQKSVVFLSEKHDEQIKINAMLQEKLAIVERNQEVIKDKIKHSDKQQDALEQYGRRNCLVIHGVAESENESTDEVFVELVNTNLGLSIKQRDLDRSHRLGKPNSNGRARPIIAKFARYNVRAKVFANKKKMKGSNMMLTESLTRHRVVVLNEARKRYGNNNVWTADGEIYSNDNGIKGRVDIW